MIKLIEKIFEWLLWKSRLIVILAVIFTLLGAAGLFVLGSYDIFNTIKDIFPLSQNVHEYDAVLIGVIGAVDLYLIGVVLLLFSFGIYELFVSKIDIAQNDESENILDIGSLDELKNKILKVIIMVLIVTFFKNVVQMHFTTSLEMVYLALSIVMLAASVYLIRKQEDEKHGS